MKLYFDIDGVLNNTPARGNRGFGVDNAMVARLMSIPGDKVCISFWRLNSAHEIKLPFPFTFAPKGAKKFCHPGATLIIDDQPSLYLPDAPVYATNGYVGLTDDDVEAILRRLGVAHGSRVGSDLA